MGMTHSKALEGLQVSLDQLVHERNMGNLPIETPHAFIYFLTITNLTDREVTLLGRKWIIEEENGEIQIIEGDKIVGKTPVLSPGESFSYNSYHVSAGNALAKGVFYGVDQWGNPIHTLVPSFELIIPDDN